jgi:hypothetical protein
MSGEDSGARGLFQTMPPSTEELARYRAARYRAAAAGDEWLLTTDDGDPIETFFGTETAAGDRAYNLARQRNQRVWMQPASGEWPP